MSGERAEAESKITPPEGVETDEDRIRALNEKMDLLKEQLDLLNAACARGIADDTTIQQLLVMFALGNFSAAFVQALGKQAAEGAAKHVGNLVRTRVRRKDKPDEYEIGLPDGASATIVVTSETPDEARLALLDLDVTADGLRGKVLRWDEKAMAWRPDDPQV